MTQRHCGKHDKIYDDDPAVNKPCPGCETEKENEAAAHGEEGHEHVEGDEEEKKT